MRWFQSKAIAARWRWQRQGFSRPGLAHKPQRRPRRMWLYGQCDRHRWQRAALPGATATDSSGVLRGRSDASGKMIVQCLDACRLAFAAPGFADKNSPIRLGDDHPARTGSQ